jgi:hypothetical protein
MKSISDYEKAYLWKAIGNIEYGRDFKKSINEFAYYNLPSETVSVPIQELVSKIIDVYRIPTQPEF